MGPCGNRIHARDDRRRQRARRAVSSPAASPAHRPAPCWPSSRRASWAVRPVRRERWRTAAGVPERDRRRAPTCASRLPTSGCGSACTRSPTAFSSGPTRGWPNTCRRSLAVITDDANQEVSRGRRQAGGVRPQPSQRQRERFCRTEFRGCDRHSAGDSVRAAAQGARPVAGAGHAAGGARRSRDGRRRARGGAVGGHHQAQVQRAAPTQAAAAATRDPRRCWASTPSSTSTPAARRSSTTWWQRWAWRRSTPCGRVPKPCRCQRKSTNHSDGSTGSSSDAAQGRSPTFARAHLPGDGRWCVALSGGADSLALAAAAAQGCAPPRRLIVDHGLQAESATRGRRRARSGH